MGLIVRIIEKIKKMRNPIKYWRKKGVTIGDNCEIQPKVDFGSEPYLIKIGNHVRINNDVLFITHDGGVWVLRNSIEEYNDIDLFGSISIGDNVHIGNRTIIMPGVKIGNNCIIACGSIVTKAVPNNSVVAGIPARIIETIDDYKKKNICFFQHTKKMPKNKKEALLKEQIASNSSIIK